MQCKHRFSILALFLSALFLPTMTPAKALAVTAPSVISSIPADGDITADPATVCLEVTFSEPMTGAYAWRWSDTVWNEATTSWSADMRTVSFCRTNGASPLALGSYTISLNPAAQPGYFKASATSLPLPETAIHFTVTAGGSNEVDITPPTIVSSSPADGQSNIAPQTAGITIVFSEAMDFSNNLVYDAWTVTNNAWDPANVIYSLAVGDTSLTITRQDGNALASGSYTLTLNPTGYPRPMIDLAGNPLAETSISFTVGSTPAASEKVYYVPYFSVGASTWTGLALANNSASGTASVLVRLYSHDGSVITTLPAIAIAPDGQYNGALATAGETRGWLRISSDEELSGLCFLGTGLMADIPFSDTLANELMIPHVAQDEIWDTTIMVCNPSESSATSLSFTYSTRDGSSLTYLGSVTLAPLQSSSYALGELFNSALPLTGGRLRIVAGGSQVAAFALYSNEKSGGSYFAGINAVPLN